MSVNQYYELTLSLLDKTIDVPTPISTVGRVINGDLTPFRHRIELVNTGNSKTDNGVLTLRIPPDGTFARTEPILIDEGAKDQYIIEAQIRQSDGIGGTRKGKIFRFNIGSPTLQDDVEGGETLKLSLIPIEYRLKEHLTSRQLKFQSPKDSFQSRLLDYNTTKGAGSPSMLFSSANIKLPDDDENLKQNWEPQAPTKTWDLLKDVIDRLSLPPIAGGTFTDFYFDCESSSSPAFSGDLTNGDITIVDVKAEAFGLVDSGVILDPLSVSSPVDAERDKTIRTDLIKFKNNIVMEGSTRGGSLPMERTKFNSNWQHAQNRPEYNGGATYYDGSDSVNGQSLVKHDFSSPFSGRVYTRYFKYIGTNGQSALFAPDDPSQTDWHEDFTVIPEWNIKGEYSEFEVVTVTGVTDIVFWELLPVGISGISGTGTVSVTTVSAHGLSSGNYVDIIGTNNFNVKQVNVSVTGANTFTYAHAGSGTPESPSLFDAYVPRTRLHQKDGVAPSTGGGWENTFNDIDKDQHTDFFSYTPWTSDYYLQDSNLSGTPVIDTWDIGVSYGISAEVQLSGSWYIAELPTTGDNPASGLPWRLISTTVPTWNGCVPDFNFERANFDRVKSDDQFEQISFKAVVRAQRTQASIPTDEIVNGARFLINGTGVGTDFAGNDNKVAEWFQPPFTLFAQGIWKFSKAPSADDEMVLDLSTAQVWRWDSSSWSVTWTPKPDNGGTTSPMHAVSNGDELSLNPLNPSIQKSGFCLVGGSTQIPAQAIRLTYHWDQFFGSSMNLSSRGAWWVQHLPVPRFDTIGHTAGDVYANSTLDTTNLDLDSNGNQGWNNGLDSEDLGRISALTMKVRLSAYDDKNNLVNGYANMPFKAWAIDVFGRIWMFDTIVKRNGEYSFIRILFGDNAPQKLYHNRIDELFSLFGFTFSQNFFLKQKEFTGIEFDWRFVKSFGLFWNVSYDDNGMYTGVRDQFVETLTSWAHQVGNNTISFYSAGGIPRESYIIDYVQLDIDELAFEKQLFANSDDVEVTGARTELTHVSNENDYLNLKGRAQGEKARKEFVNQEWHMLAHGDVRMRLGQKFKVIGDRVPEQPSNYSVWSIITNYDVGDKVSRNGFVWQSLQDNNIARTPENTPEWWQNINESVCAEVKHIIDNDGYMMQILGVRKFVFS